MTEKTAGVHWEGQGKKGQGKISTETEALKHYPYGFASRFEDDRLGTEDRLRRASRGAHMVQRMNPVNACDHKTGRVTFSRFYVS